MKAYPGQVSAVPLRTAQGTAYLAVVTLPGYQAAPPLAGMTADVRLGP